MNRHGRTFFMAWLAGLFLWLAGLCAFASDGLQMDVLDVGQGLSVLISCGDHYALYDGGGRDSSSYVVSCLQQHAVTHLDYLISSHYDEDHLAGLIGVLYTADCDYVLSADYVADTQIYQSFQQAVSAKGLTQIHPTAGDVYYMGDAVIDIVGPVKKDAASEDDAAAQTQENVSENDSCVAIRVCYGDTAFLMCGDAQASEEKEMLRTGENLSADVYVVSHHGSGTSSTEAFLDAVSPEDAVISCGAGNEYGHPAAQVLDALSSRGCRIFRTDRQGEITAWSDGENVSFNQDPTEDLTPGTYVSENPAGKSQENDTQSGQALPQTGYNYICNRNTGVFHYPDCRSVSQMKESNKIYTGSSRDELIAQGYTPCGNCNP